MKRDVREPGQSSHLSGAQLEDAIRRRAYELYEGRGRTGGRELEDWVQAESEVRESSETARAA